MSVLDRLYKEHKFEHALYSKIKKNIEFNHIEDKKSISEFVEDLPVNLKTSISVSIYKNLYNKVDFLKNKTPQFIAWICPLLKVRIAAPDEVIYYEGDALERNYFLRSGLC